MRNLRVMSVRRDADSSYTLSALRGYEYVLGALRKYFHIKEIWIVEIGGSNFKKYDEKIELYNAFSFANGNEIIDNLKPDLVVSSAGDYEYLHRSILKAATRKGIPTVDILYSAFGLSILNEGYEREKTVGRLYALWRHGPSIAKRYIFLLRTLYHADHTLGDILRTIMLDLYLPFVSWLPRYRFGGGDLNIVSTPGWVDFLVKNRIDKKKIVVVGDISMDPVYHKLMLLNDKNNETVRVENRNNIEILLITSPMADHGLWTSSMQNELVTKVAENIVKQFKNRVNFRIKIHPTSESLETYNRILSSIAPSVEVIQKADLLSLVDKSDIIISFGNSSALFEPLLLRKPIYIINIFNEDASKNLYLKENVATECRTIDELIEKIRNASSSQIDLNRIYAFVEKQVYLFDGKCSERAAKHIISLLENRVDLAESS
jgi:hypothetical protein